MVKVLPNKMKYQSMGATFQEVGLRLKMLLAMLLWLGPLHGSVLLVWYSAIALLPTGHPLALTIVVIGVALLLIPINGPEGTPPEWGQQLAKFIVETVPEYFPMRLVFEDRCAYAKDRAYVVALEPHSVLPLSIIAFSDHITHLPFNKTRLLGSSALSYTPVGRHLWTWMGMEIVSRDRFRGLLAQGISCVLCPGGVQECLHMKKDCEVLYLHKRRGFIRLALEAGAPLVPAFCFGQRDVYNFWYPAKHNWFARFSRCMRYAPIIFWGLYGTFLPRPKPMLIVVGKPLEVTKTPQPSEEDIDKVQGIFIAKMQELYDRHKVEAGAKDISLVVI